MASILGVQLFGSYLAISWLLKVLVMPKNLPPSICQSKKVTFWALTLHLTFLDWQIENGEFFGSEGQFKTWWGQHNDFLKWPKKLKPLQVDYLLAFANFCFLLNALNILSVHSSSKLGLWSIMKSSRALFMQNNQWLDWDIWFLKQTLSR